MLSQLARQSVIYIACNVIARGIGFLVLPFYTRVFAPADFGTFDFVTAVLSLCVPLVTIEISQAVARFFPSATSLVEKQAIASAGFLFTVVSYTVASVAICVLAEPLSSLLTDGRHGRELLYASALSFWAGGVFYFFQNQLRWQLDVMLYAVVSLVSAVVAAGSAVALILIYDKGIESLFYGMCVGNVVGAVLAGWSVRENLAGDVNWDRILFMIKFSAPLAISGLAAIASSYLDRVILKQLLSIEDVGFYGVAYRFASVVNIALIGFQSSITPMVTAHHEDTGLRDHLAGLLEYFTVFALTMLLGLALFSLEILDLVAGNRYSSAHALLPVIAGGILVGGMYVFAPGLWIGGRTHLLLGINIGTALVNLVGNLILIRPFGTMGAAVALQCSAAFNFASYLLLGQKFYRIETNWTKLIGAALLCVCLGMIGNATSLGGVSLVTFKALLWCSGSVAVAVLVIGRQRIAWLVSEVRSKGSLRFMLR